MRRVESELSCSRLTKWWSLNADPLSFGVLTTRIYSRIQHKPNWKVVMHLSVAFRSHSQQHGRICPLLKLCGDETAWWWWDTLTSTVLKDVTVSIDLPLGQLRTLFGWSVQCLARSREQSVLLSPVANFHICRSQPNHQVRLRLRWRGRCDFASLTPLPVLISQGTARR